MVNPTSSWISVAFNLDFRHYRAVFVQKITYILKTAGRILMQFYMAMCLSWLYKLKILGVTLTFDLESSVQGLCSSRTHYNFVKLYSSTTGHTS